MRHESSSRSSKKQPAKRPPAKAAPAKSKKQNLSKVVAKNKGLAAVEALLSDPVGVVETPRAGAEAGARPAIRPAGLPAKGAPAAQKAPTEMSRFERCLQRADKGEPGPIRLSDLVIDDGMVARAQDAVESYRKILEKNPHAQPGRPLVNVVGTGDRDLRFVVLSLHELVAAARLAGRESIQVSLVRLNEKDAQALAHSERVEPPAPVMEAKPLTPREIAMANGFMELKIKDIVQDENIRAVMDDASPQFANLVESIRAIGLQNAPVVELRMTSSTPPSECFVCVSGHRRLRALQVLGVESVVCSLKLFKSEKQRIIATLAENVNRQDLHFLDKAEGYGALEGQGMTATEIASLLDTDPRTIGKFLRAASWDASVKERVRALGTKVTTRFLLNFLAAGVRTTSELHALLDKLDTRGPGKSAGKSARAVRQRLDEFFSLTACSAQERYFVEKALKYLGFIK